MIDDRITGGLGIITSTNYSYQTKQKKGGTLTNVSENR